MALIGRMQIVGSKQGLFKGECHDAKWRNYFPIVSLQSEFDLPGFDVSKQTSPSSPQLFQNAVNAENFGFQYQIEHPRDQGTGQASGKRQWKPIQITKEWGATSPQLFNAVATSEVMQTIIIHVADIEEPGPDEIVHTLVLSSAMILAMKPETGPAGRPANTFTISFDDIEAVVPPPNLPDEVFRRLPWLFRR
jgi:type VI protein secretion system component Hcp